MRSGSIAAFALMVAGIALLYYAGGLLARHPLAIAVQAAAVVLMIAARLAFGARSFHAAANPTEGGIVTRGPYAFLRHPIYAAVLYFVWAGALDHLSTATIAAAVLMTAGAAARMLLEERMLVVRYPEYRAYMQRTRRVVPFVL